MRPIAKTVRHSLLPVSHANFNEIMPEDLRMGPFSIRHQGSFRCPLEPIGDSNSLYQRAPPICLMPLNFQDKILRLNF